jgi:AcrR family transcriptional regulator
MYLFWEHGYANAGMAEILKRAGANSGSFYYFFKSKSELLCAVLDEYASNFASVILEPVFRQVDGPLKRIFAILSGYRERLTGTGRTHLQESRATLMPGRVRSKSCCGRCRMSCRVEPIYPSLLSLSS